MSATSLRFWSEVTIVPEGFGFALLLDGKPARLPGGGGLSPTSRAFAEAMAAEWRAAGGGAKGGRFAPNDIGLTRLYGTMLARVAPNRASVVGQLAGYGDTDLLCYRAEGPPALLLRQAQAWQPLLDWMLSRHGVRLRWGQGIMPVRQDDEARLGLRRLLEAATDASLTALGVMAPCLGSVVLALAVLDGRLQASNAAGLSQLDEMFQAELWGEDPALADARRQVANDVAEALRFVQLIEAAA